VDVRFQESGKALRLTLCFASGILIAIFLARASPVRLTDMILEQVGDATMPVVEQESSVLHAIIASSDSEGGNDPLGFFNL